MISGFVVYRGQGNIDLTNIAIITNFSLNPVGDENFTSFKNVKYGPQKNVSKHLNEQKSSYN